MRPHPHRAIAAALGLAFSLAAFTSVAAATPVETGCPASADLTAVSSFDEAFYGLPKSLDDPANGGNGDGLICAFALPKAVQVAWGSPVPVYQFFENRRGAHHRH